MAEFAVIIPTLNEIENIEPVLERLNHVLEGIDWEVIFVDDDSPDGTAAAIRQISVNRPHVRVIQRIGRGGLASACIEGMLATSAPYLAVTDADLQHDVALLPNMLALLKAENLDLVVGSRNLDSGGKGDFAPHRRLLSDLGAKVSKAVCRCEITDPMSGFFAIRRAFFDTVVRRLSGIGFKILVDILAAAPGPVRMKELPFVFRNRERGESKLDVNTGIEYFLLIADKLVGGIVPARFLAFAIVGSIGVVLYLLVLELFYRQASLSFAESQAIAAFLAMNLNFILNNLLTFRELRLRGWGILKGVLIFYAACTLGLVANIALATFCVNKGIPWYVAAVLGLTVGSVWNFAVTSVLTWRRLRRRIQRSVSFPVTQGVSQCSTK